MLPFGLGKPLGGGECLILKIFDLLTQPCVLFPRRAGDIGELARWLET